ncbi:DUF3304 domain-containing protein [Morganella psychrotolerans]|uniref:DUF3304 domain-containing protein n=1 Tax=Morganella psychrotolerans TaxID=368603 RepID=A0A5M9QYZ7_9GAMM|nr:DUF3304 domain-containing protein [Morganella psychrotolerans]KAA8713600.1 DUF3304 domain-containing protein [Morganella psychrotolerans]OBU05733.1 hypothetical protein AYY16_10990 [Morganella psychrotolerans]
MSRIINRLKRYSRRQRVIGVVIIGMLSGGAWLLHTPEPVFLAGNLSGYNHMKGTAVNWFEVNGNRGRGAGGTCCIMVSEKWQPGMEVLVEWEVDPDRRPKNMPSVTDPAFEEFMEKHKANYKRYKKIVPIPEYDDPCSVKVHFLPCQEVKITLSCRAPWHPEYPVKEPLQMEEPAVCPK